MKKEQIYPIVIAILIVIGAFSTVYYFKNLKTTLQEIASQNQVTGYYAGLSAGRKYQTNLILQQLGKLSQTGTFVPDTSSTEMWARVK